MNKRIVLKFSSVWLFLLTAVITHAQFKPGSFANGIMPNVLPSSPEAASLGKYGEWPVSQYTGVPSINIPLYQINVSGYQLPVSLSYHAGGVKIDEVAPWVGTNWSLNAGGVINRTVVGKPDENINGFLYRNQRNITIKSSYDLTTAEDFAFMKDVSGSNIDVEPDIFYYNFGGNSGKFYFDQTGKFQCIPVNSLKLIKSPINNTLVTSDDKHWEIADQGGNLYFFGSYQEGENGFENTRVFSGPQSAPHQTTAWYLTKIILSNRADTIYFDYTNKLETYTLPENHSLRILTAPISYAPPPSASWEELLKLNTVLVNGDFQTSPGDISLFSATGKSILSKIRWKSGEVVFAATTSRQDITGGKMLDMVTVNNQAGNKIKDIKLKYSYVHQRYFLDSLIEMGSYGTEQVAHSFQYINRNDLPARGSYAQDHWGFYNGAGGNTSLLPPEPSISNLSLSANREPDEVYAPFGTLEKITYPTGGYTLFNYECHRYDPASPVGGGNPGSQIVTSVIVVKAADPQPGGYSRTQTFSIPFTQNTPSVALQFVNYAKPVSKQQAWLPLVKIEKLISGSYQTMYYWDAFDNFPTGTITPNQYGLVDFNLNQSISLDVGDYRITTDLVCGGGNCGTPAHKPEVTAQLTYSAYSGQLPMAGGLRIKQITNYDYFGQSASIKKFLYEPGKLLIYPKYLHQHGEDVFLLSACAQDQFCYAQYYCPGVYAKYKEVTSSSQAILGFTQGAAVGYTSVKEFNVNSAGADNGFTAYSFNFVPDVLNTASFDGSYWNGVNISNPSIPLNNTEYKRGLLTAKEVYKKSNEGAYIKIYSLNNSYQFNDNNPANRYNSLRAMRVKQMRNVNYRCGTTYNGYMFPAVPPTPDFMYGYYDLITSWVQQISTTEITYDQNGNNPSTVSTAYTYNNANHLQATGVSKADSKGNIVSVANKYPDDYTALTATDNTTAGIKLLQQRYIQDKIIESANYYKIGAAAPVLTSAAFTSYNPLVPYPDKIQMIESATNLTNFAVSSVAAGAITKDSRYVDQVFFDAYDNNGNILQAHKHYETNTSYIYDHLNSYPVAQVKNAANTVIAYTSFEADGKGYWTYTGTPLLDPTCPTGRKVYSLTPSTTLSKSGLTAGASYIVSYWTKNASAFSITGTSTGYPVSGRTVNGWKYFEHKISGQSSITLSGTGLIDEVRLYPADAEMITYTYNSLIGVTGQCATDSRIIYYEYDAFQRLILQRDQDRNIIKKISYNYNGQTENNSIFYNDQQSGSYIKSCPVGQTGSSVMYTVPDGTYSAYSLAIANALAVADVNANGQAFANSTGTCTVSSININGYNSKESDYRLRLTNTSTSVIYNFTLPANTFSPSLLGQVPPGTYTVQFQPNPQPVPSATYNINGFTFSGGSSATFNNISITSTSTASMY